MLVNRLMVVYTKKVVFIVLFFLELIVLFFLSRTVTNDLSLLLYRLTRSQKITIHLLSIVFLPGVIIHELSHMFVAMLLFVRVGDIEFMPQLREDGVKLGSVEITKTDPIRRALIGVAPVLGGIGILTLLLAYFSDGLLSLPRSFPDILKTGMILYAIFAVANTMFSSKKDIEGTLELGAAVLLIIGGLYVAGLRIPQGTLDVVLSKHVLSIFQTLSLFLLVPLGVDGIVFGATRIVRKR